MRTIDDILQNLVFVGCDNETARDLCGEVMRLRALNAEMREAAFEYVRAQDAWDVARHSPAPPLIEAGKRLMKARDGLAAILAKTETD